MKKGRIDKFSKGLLSNAEYIVIKTLVYPGNTFYSPHAFYDNTLWNLYTGSGVLFFDSQKEVINFIKRHRGPDLKDPNNNFRIILLPSESPDFSSCSS